MSTVILLKLIAIFVMIAVGYRCAERRGSSN
jgi:hypothetical protein